MSFPWFDNFTLLLCFLKVTNKSKNICRGPGCRCGKYFYSREELQAHYYEKGCYKCSKCEDKFPSGRFQNWSFTLTFHSLTAPPCEHQFEINSQNDFFDFMSATNIWAKVEMLTGIGQYDNSPSRWVIDVGDRCEFWIVT